ncbi:MAG: polyketide cyclase [Mycobacterium sp.]
MSDDEVARRYPCDEFVAMPTLQAWRGVTVRATPETLWPWVTQIRLAPYSYDWIDNLGRRSPRRLMNLPGPVVGEPFSTAATRPFGQVLAVEPPEHLTGEIMGACISYVLVPQGPSTRLLMKLVSGMSRWAAPWLSVGDLVMARRQLLNLKALAERP